MIPYKFKVPNVAVPTTPVITIFETTELVAVPNEVVIPKPVTETTIGMTPDAVPHALVPATPVVAKVAPPVTTVPVALSVLSCAPIKA